MRLGLSVVMGHLQGNSVSKFWSKDRSICYMPIRLGLVPKGDLGSGSTSVPHIFR
jgi:hypothetical protein